MKPIIWVFATLYVALLADVVSSAPSQTSIDVTNSQTDDLDGTNADHDRLKRASRTGQTQSQYLNFGDSQTEGKADAEITRFGSRASVSGSNGMGQAQSQSSGSGCEECYGNDNGYAHGAAPDPLRSSSGASGLPQSQTSSNIPSISSGPGYDAYGRPINLPNIGVPSGYTSQGFGPSSGPSGRLPSDRIKEAYGNGYPSGIDSQQPGALGGISGPGSITEQQPGVHTHNGRGPSSGSSFLNQPISSGKPTGAHIDTNGRAPSILAGRKNGSNGLDAGKLIDGTTHRGNQPSPSTIYGASHENVPTNGRTSPSNRLSTSGSQLPSYSSISSPDALPGRSQPIRSGTYDTNGYPDGRLPSTTTGLQPIDQSRAVSSLSGRPSTDAYGQTRSGSIGENGNAGGSNGSPSTDVLTGLRNAFKLPPGLCLVRCDTLRSGQTSLSTDQIRDAFISSGLPGPGQSQTQPQRPQSGLPTEQRQPSGEIGGNLPSSQYVQPSQGQQQAGSPSGYPYTGGQSTSGTPSGQYVPTGYPSGQGQGQGQGQLPQSGGQQYPTYPSNVYLQSGTPSAQLPQAGGGGSSYPQTGIPSGYPQSNVPSGYQPTGTVPGYPQSGTPSGQLPQSGGGAAGIPTGYPQSNVPSGYQPTGVVSGYPQSGTPSGQLPQSGGGAAGIPTGYPQSNVPSGYQPTGVVSGYPQSGTSSGQLPQSGGGTSGYPYTGIPSGYPQSNVPSGYQPTGAASGYPQSGTPSAQLPQAGGGAAGIPQSGVSSGYPQPGGFPTTPVQVSTGGGGQTGSYVPGNIPQSGGAQYPSAGGYAQYPQTPTSQIPSASQVLPGQTQPGNIPTYQQTQYPSQQGTPQSGAGLYPTSPAYIPNQVQSGLYPQTGIPSGYPQSGISSNYPPTGTSSGQLPQTGIPSGYPQTGGVPTTLPSGQSTSGTPSGQYVPTGYPTGQGQGQGQGQLPQSGGQQYPTYPSNVYPQSGISQQPGIGGGQISGGQSTQTGSSVQYPPSTGYIPSPAQGGGAPSQGQQYQPNGNGQYLPQYPASTPIGGYSGTPTYNGQTPSTYTGQIYPTAYPGVGDSTAAQSVPSGVPVNYVAGGTTGSGTSSGESGVATEQGEHGEGDDGYSQAESSIKNGEVVASAQGTKNGGTAQTQVQGTYSGSGSFSASAQTADKDRSVQAQVSGHKDGALSSSQGTGGKSQAQAQVEVNEKTGGTSASGQTSGLKHTSQSEVTANEKGGLADAQSSGPGQTSSQAQIGFRPESASTSQPANIFNGGGQASAQSGVHSGQSQSQIQGNFKYGISYHGAAQAASGTREQVNSYREKSKKLFQSIGQFSRSNRDAVTSAPVSDIANLNDIGAKSKSSSIAPDATTDDSFPDDEDYENDEGEDAYDDDDDNAEKSGGVTKKPKTKTARMEVELPVRFQEISTTSKPNQENTVNATPATTVTESKSTKLIHLPAVRSEIVPDGFKGKIDEKRQKHNLTASKNDLNNDEMKVDVKPDSYVTVTKSVSGSLDNAKSTPTDDKKFQSTYYTKSSTCGYFTFSCNIVYGSNGRSKICRPKTPANGKC